MHRIAVLLLALAAVATCDRTEPTPRPDVVWVVLDAASAGHFSLYGYERNTTPRIDRFAEGSLVWERAYAQAPQTTSSTASFLTGRYPPEAIAKKRLQGPTLAGRLRAAGYRTVAFSENPWVSARVGFDEGFDAFHPVSLGARMNSKSRATIARALADMDESSGQPLFLYLHLLPPHSPYNAPPPMRGRFGRSSPRGKQRGFMTVVLGDQPEPADFKDFRTVLLGEASLSSAELDLLRARYDENLAFVDAQVGELLAGLRSRGRLGRSLVIVSADHGEAFGEHGLVMHSSSLYDEQIRVPLVMRLPEGMSEGGERSGRRREPVQLVDLPATVLRLLGLTATDTGPGRSLLDPAQSGREPVRSFAPDGTQAVIEGRFKLITSKGDESPLLFDLEADPGERENLAGTQADRVARLRELAWRGSLTIASPGLGDVDDDTRDQLEKLGYLEGEP